jgi:hypothetical protein
MKLYIAGPMTGLPEFNYPAFNAAEGMLKAAGYEVLNPARQPDGMEYADYLAFALADVFACDGIALLPYWDESPGANAEVALADALKKDASELGVWLTLGIVKRGQLATD